MFRKKGALRNFTGKYLCQSLFLNKVAGSGLTALLKKRFWHKCFPVNFAKFLGTPSLKKHFWWLLLMKHRKTPENHHVRAKFRTLKGLKGK